MRAVVTRTGAGIEIEGEATSKAGTDLRLKDVIIGDVSLLEQIQLRWKIRGEQSLGRLLVRVEMIEMPVSLPAHSGE